MSAILGTGVVRCVVAFSSGIVDWEHRHAKTGGSLNVSHTMTMGQNRQTRVEVCNGKEKKEHA